MQRVQTPAIQGCTILKNYNFNNRNIENIEWTLADISASKYIYICCRFSSYFDFESAAVEYEHKLKLNPIQLFSTKNYSLPWPVV